MALGIFGWVPVLGFEAPGTGIVSIFVLREKGGLCSSPFAVSKVAQPYADKPVVLLWAQVHSFS